MSFIKKKPLTTFIPIIVSFAIIDIVLKPSMVQFKANKNESEIKLNIFIKYL